MKIVMTLVATALGLTLPSMTQAVSFVIDDFVVPPGGQSVNIVGTGVSAPNTATGLAGVLGGSRTMQNTVFTSTFGLSSQVIVSPLSPGTLSFSNDSGQDATATVLWDANGAGLGGVDLTSGGLLSKFQTKVLASDLNVGLRIDITETAAAGGSNAFWSANLGPGVTFVSELLANFTGAASVDFTQVNRIMLTLNGPLAQDSTIDLLEITSSSSQVPEPVTAGLGMMGLAALGLVAARRRRA